VHGNATGGHADVVVTTPALYDGGVQTGGVVFLEDWESYNVGEQVHGQNGWKGWDNDPNAGALVSDAQNHTDGGSKCIDINGGTDLVREFAQDLGATENSGQWRIRAWQYIPSDLTLQTWFIWQNEYADGGPYKWSVQVRASIDSGVIHADFRGEELPLLTDQWVEWVIDVDLDKDLSERGSQTLTYGGQTLYADQPWACGTQDGDCGFVQIGSIDLYAAASSSTYYDDISIEHLPRIIGACCNDAEETCTDDSHLGNCPVGRFIRGGTCDGLDPPCGEYNDECVSAIAIGADDSITETSQGATWTFNDYPMCFGGGDQATRTLWFKFTATNNFTRVRTCPSPIDGGAEDTLVSVFPSGPNGECLQFEPDIGCADDVCGAPAGLHAEVCVPTTPGDVYYVMVGSKPDAAPGLFTLQTSSHAECPAPTIGACCGTNQQDGSEFCFDQNSGDCFGLAGYYSGDDTRCADDNCPDCNPACPDGQTPEGGFCGFDATFDNNSGCNGAGNPEDFTAVELDEVVCGLGSSNGTTRDTDWMSVELEAGVAYQFRVNHDFPALVGFSGYNAGFEGSGDCADGSGFISPGGNQEPGESIVAFTPIATGTYFPYVAVSAVGGVFHYVPCCSGSNSYSAVVELAGGGCTREPAWQCDGDTDGDGQVNPVDSGLVQSAFGSTDEADLCQYDMDCDGQINPVDSGIVQSLFGSCNAPRAVCP
jgi:hypothetical protein